MGPPAASAAVVLVNIEPAFTGLIGQWLAGAGLAAIDGAVAREARRRCAHRKFATGVVVLRAAKAGLV